MLSCEQVSYDIIGTGFGFFVKLDILTCSVLASFLFLCCQVDRTSVIKQSNRAVSSLTVTIAACRPVTQL